MLEEEPSHIIIFTISYSLMTLEALETFSNISNVCKTEHAENMHSRESMQIRSSISTPNATSPLSNRKKGKVVTILLMD